MHLCLCPGRSLCLRLRSLRLRLRLRLRRVPPRLCPRCHPQRYLGLGRLDCLLGSPRSHAPGWAGDARGNGALDPLLPVLLQAPSPGGGKTGQCRTHAAIPSFQPWCVGLGHLGASALGQVCTFAGLGGKCEGKWHTGSSPTCSPPRPPRSPPRSISGRGKDLTNGERMLLCPTNFQP